jgi:Zn finger protein HypA/HybF involved in hydrogenase expression
MKLIIDMPEDILADMKNGHTRLGEIADVVAKGTVFKKGKWISHYDELGYTCSVCGAFRMSAKTDNFKFCPDCGADLRGAEK